MLTKKHIESRKKYSKKIISITFEPTRKNWLVLHISSIGGWVRILAFACVVLIVHSLKPKDIIVDIK
jgi:hypothetical protein